MNIPFILTPKSLVIVLNDEPISITTDHQEFEAILNAVRNDLGEDTIRDLISPKNTLETLLKRDDGYIEIVGNQLVCTLYGYEFPTPEIMVKAILEMHKQGISIAPIYEFIKRLANNGDPDIVQQLFGFLTSSGMAITPRGTFLCYKNITQDDKDIYTRSIDNSAGTVVKMPRHAVNKDPNQTCSAGLHVCAYSYLRHYGNGAKTVIVEVDPANVVSIPTDYNNAKMRVCEYKVLREITRPEELKDTYLIDEFEDSDFDDEYDEEFDLNEDF